MELTLNLPPYETRILTEISEMRTRLDSLQRELTAHRLSQKSNATPG